MDVGIKQEPIMPRRGRRITKHKSTTDVDINQESTMLRRGRRITKYITTTMDVDINQESTMLRRNTKEITNTMDVNIKQEVKYLDEVALKEEEITTEEHPILLFPECSFEKSHSDEETLTPMESNRTETKNTASQTDTAQADICLQTEHPSFVDATVQVDLIKKVTAQTQTEVFEERQWESPTTSAVTLLEERQWESPTTSAVTGGMVDTRGMFSRASFAPNAPTVYQELVLQIQIAGQQQQQTQTFQLMPQFGMYGPYGFPPKPQYFHHQSLAYI